MRLKFLCDLCGSVVNVGDGVRVVKRAHVVGDERVEALALLVARVALANDPNAALAAHDLAVAAEAAYGGADLHSFLGFGVCVDVCATSDAGLNLVLSPPFISFLSSHSIAISLRSTLFPHCNILIYCTFLYFVLLIASLKFIVTLNSLL